MKNKKLWTVLTVLSLAMTFTACKGEVVTPDPDPDPVNVVIDNPVTPDPDNPDNEEDPNLLYDGKVVIDDCFEEGDEPVWGMYNNGGNFNILYENGEMVVDINKVGNLEYSVQCFRDKHVLNMGGVYEVSFDVHCDIEREMKWRFQINGGDYHEYYEQIDMIGPETQNISALFTMNEATDPAPRFCFNLGLYDSMETAPDAHRVYFDNFKLVLVDASNAQAVEPLPDPIAIKVNQIGYKTEETKKVVITSDKPVSEFNVCKTSDDSVVFTGKFGSDAMESPSGDGNAYTGDFTEFKEPGEYYIKAEGFDNSYPFTIADDVYEDATAASVKMLYLQRCGCETTSELAGDFAHGVCHNTDARIYGTEDFIEVSGGWHDAGDYGRYIVAGAKTVEDLLLSYEESEGARGDDYGIPESGNGIPDILDEAKYELDFMLKMQNEEGGVYHKVTCAVFPENSVKPDEETEELIVCPVSATATGAFAAVTAKASIIYKDIDAEFAKNCLEASKKAYTYFFEHQYDNRNGFVNPEDIATGEYPDTKNTDEGIWAAVELYIATNDSVYAEKIKELSTSPFKTGLGWADVGTYAMYEYLKSDCAKDEEVNESFKNSIIEMAGKSLEKSKEDPFASSLRSYPWGSNMSIANAGMLYKMAYDITGDEEYLNYSKAQLDYLFGINPMGYCYLTGYGTLKPEHVHHRPSAAAGKTMPGMLVGGPNSAPSDPYGATVLADRIGGMCYVDNDSAFSVNEITIYWNSPMIYLLEMYK